MCKSFFLSLKKVILFFTSTQKKENLPKLRSKKIFSYVLKIKKERNIFKKKLKYYIKAREKENIKKYKKILGKGNQWKNTTTTRKKERKVDWEKKRKKKKENINRRKFLYNFPCGVNNKKNIIL